MSARGGNFNFSLGEGGVREGALGGEGGERALEAPVQAILRTGV